MVFVYGSLRVAVGLSELYSYNRNKIKRNLYKNIGLRWGSIFRYFIAVPDSFVIS